MTATRDPQVGQKPITNSKPSQPHPNSNFKWLWLIVAVVLVAMAFLAFRPKEDQGPEQLRSKAEAVLKARFNDTMSGKGVAPLKSMSVVWKDDKLVATWVQGDSKQKSCTAPVLVSADQQQFGIATFEAVSFDKQPQAPATCITTEGLEFGLPLG